MPRAAAEKKVAEDRAVAGLSFYNRNSFNSGAKDARSDAKRNAGLAEDAARDAQVRRVKADAAKQLADAAAADRVGRINADVAGFAGFVRDVGQKAREAAGEVRKLGLSFSDAGAKDVLAARDQLADLKREADEAGKNGIDRATDEYGGSTKATDGQVAEYRALQQKIAAAEEFKQLQVEAADAGRLAAANARDFAAGGLAAGDMADRVRTLNEAASQAAARAADQQRGLAKAQVEANDAARKQVDAAKRLNEEFAEARSLIESTRTPAEKLAADIARITKLNADGLLTADQAKRALAKAAKDDAGAGAEPVRPGLETRRFSFDLPASQKDRIASQAVELAKKQIDQNDKLHTLVQGLWQNYGQPGGQLFATAQF